jgi:hypothetical protein
VKASRVMAVSAIAFSVLGCVNPEAEDVDEAKNASTGADVPGFDAPAERLQWATLRAKRTVDLPRDGLPLILPTVDEVACALRVWSSAHRVWIAQNEKVKVSGFGRAAGAQVILELVFAKDDGSLVVDRDGAPTRANHVITCSYQNGRMSEGPRSGEIRRALSSLYDVEMMKDGTGAP